MIWMTQYGWLGVDFGTRAVKVAQTMRVKGNILLHEAACALPPAQSLPFASLDKLPEVSWQGLDFARASGDNFTGRNAACLLPKPCTGLEFMRIEDGKSTERRRQVQQYLDSTDRASGQTWDTWHWPVQNGRQQEENTAIMLVSRDLAESTSEGMQLRGLNCNALDGLPAALARAAGMQTHGFQGPVATLDWGSGDAQLTVNVEGIPVFVRTLRACGLGAALSNCRDSLFISEQEVESVQHGELASLFGDAIYGELRQAVSEVFQPAIDAAMAEIQRTLLYLSTHRPQWSPNGMILFGLGSLLPNIAEVVERKASLPTRIWAPTKMIDARQNKQVPMSLLGPAIALSTLSWESN